MKAILVPLDNRPVTYLFPRLVLEVAGVEAAMPPRHLMGSLSEATSSKSICDWLIDTLTASPCEAVLACLDSFLYGGLIASRRSQASISEILERACSIPRWRRIGGSRLTVFAQSSIMRISDNYDAVEEKPYWSKYGRELFAWSEMLHKLQMGKLPHASEIQCLEARIDQGVRQDYLEGRQRNFQVNRALIDYVKSGDIDYLVFSQDDSGQFGLNVLERHRLTDECCSKGIRNVVSYPGADEVLLTLISRWLVASSQAKPCVLLKFNLATGQSLPSRYEGQTIAETIHAQLAAAGLNIEHHLNGESDVARANAIASADFTVIVHTSGERQGDHILLPGHADLRQLDTSAAVACTLDLAAQTETPLVIADVAYANGADPLLVEQLLKRKDILSRVSGYAGWNTTGNTTGSAVALGVAAWFSRHSQKAQAARQEMSEVLKQALFIRLADDWAYQTQVRKQLAGDLSQQRLEEMMQPYLERIKEALDFEPGPVEVTLPWRRSFEVEITLKDSVTCQPA